MKICPHAAADAAQTDGIDDPPPMAHIETTGGRVRQGQKEARGAPRQRYRRRRKSGMLHFSAAVSSGAQAPEGAAIDGEYNSCRIAPFPDRRELSIGPHNEPRRESGRPRAISTHRQIPLFSPASLVADTHRPPPSPTGRVVSRGHRPQQRACCLLLVSSPRFRPVS